MTDWQPISTAPKSGFVLFWCTDRVGKKAERDGGYARLGHFEADFIDGRIQRGWATDGSWHPECSVSHWMPLPEPPTPATEGASS